MQRAFLKKPKALLTIKQSKNIQKSVHFDTLTHNFEAQLKASYKWVTVNDVYDSKTQRHIFKFKSFPKTLILRSKFHIFN